MTMLPNQKATDSVQNLHLKFVLAEDSSRLCEHNINSQLVARAFIYLNCRENQAFI